MPRSFFDKTTSVRLHGVDYPCPDPPVRYLEFFYGDWRTPRRDGRNLTYRCFDPGYLLARRIRKMLRLPELVETMATTLEPHQLPYYAMDLATAFHDFYEKCRVLSDDEPLSMARLKLVSAAKLTLARALGLMGMSAPERM